MVVAKTASCGIILAFVGHPLMMSRNQISSRGFQSKVWSHPCSPCPLQGPSTGNLWGNFQIWAGHFVRLTELPFSCVRKCYSKDWRRRCQTLTGGMVGEDIKKPKTMVVINALVTSCYIYRESYALFVHFILQIVEYMHIYSYTSSIELSLWGVVKSWKNSSQFTDARRFR